MSDVLLERIAASLETIAKVYSGAGSAVVNKTTAGATTPGASNKAAGGATAPKPGNAGATAPKPGAAGATAPKTGAAGAKGAPAAATKAPGGKYNSEQVRDMIRKVAANPNLGKQSARDILEADGGGVTTVSEVKAENFDAVYEACQVALSGEGAGAPAEEEFDPTA